ncbi:MAG: hypothetical protein AB1726_18705 [Planctomycetota bacterium]
MRILSAARCGLAVAVLAACGGGPPADGTFVIQGLGVEFGPWDPSTGRAGDFLFVAGEEKVFLEFGATVRAPDGAAKELPTFEYRIRPDATVRAIAAGRVVRLDFQPETGDYEIGAATLDPRFEVGYDHVRAPRIAIGDVLAPGDALGRPGPWNESLGRFEIMIVEAAAGRAWCPFSFYDVELAPAMQESVRRLMADWESFRGDPSTYAEEEQAFPGCRYESMPLY